MQCHRCRQSGGTVLEKAEQQRRDKHRGRPQRRVVDEMQCGEKQAGENIGVTQGAESPGLQALVERPVGGRLPENWKQYLPKVPKDPWGNDYVYICPGMDDRDYDIISFGEDGEQGGEGNNADITSWELD